MTSESNSPSPRRAALRWSPATRAGLVVAVLAVGAIGGAAASRFIDRAYPQSVLLLHPTAIAQVTSRGPVALKGQVAEIFGNKFVLQDGTGRALIDTGPRGDAAAPVAMNEAVTVQGYFDRGVVHADVLTRADGTSEAFGPPGPPPPHPHAPPPPPAPGVAPPAP